MIVPGQSASAAGSAAADAPLPKIADHDLLHVIGRGAYGEVWLARHLQLGTLRAVKIVRRDQFGDARPFTREFDGIQKYEPISRSHPNLVSILHVGGADDCFYYVMEVADDAKVEQASSLSDSKGEEIKKETGWKPVPPYSPHTLRSELKQHGALPIDRCLEIAHALASALAHLHANKLVHRDVKPSNVIFVDGVPKLADIGLVAGVDDARSFVGTEGYVPFHGAGTPSADCYSLGKLLYELSTGQDRTAWPEPRADLAMRPDRERLLELNAILHRACAPDPKQRYDDGQAMLAELELLQRGESIKCKRAVERRWAIGKKTGRATATLTLLATTGWLLLTNMHRELNEKKNVAVAISPEMAGTKNLEAFKLYEKARVCFRRFTIEGETLAREHLRKATEMDPNFVAAYDLLFLGYVNSWALPQEEQNAGMRATAKKLTELVPKSAEAEYANAYVKFVVDLDLPEAEKGFRHAMHLNPISGVAHLYGCHLVVMGRSEEARKELRRFDDLDPGFPIVEMLLGTSYYVERNYEQAIRHCRKSLDLAPNYLMAHLLAGKIHEAKGDYMKAIEWFQQMDFLRGKSVEQLNQRYEALRQAFTELGARGYWLKRLEQIQSSSNPDDAPYYKAAVLAELGQNEQALHWLDKAYAKRDQMDCLVLDHYWDGLRDEPQFRALLRKVGYVK